MLLDKLPTTITFPKLEEQILEFWKTNKIFEKSVNNREGKPKWTFLDGPPFVTGMPHYGTLLSSIPKDLFGRFWTMKGYQVRRVWGWDGHGLPIENKVEGKLKIKQKTEIESTVGVKKFIDECLVYVNEVSDEWEWYIDHVGRWADFKNAYKTWDTNYMESVMWVFRQMYDKGYIYKGLRVSLYCPHCITPISNFEVSMDGEENYKPVTEVSNVYKYQLCDDPNTYFLAWSTTPWNKIVTPALAVNPNLDYVKVKQGSEVYILGAETLKILNSEGYEILESFKGEKLIGMKFVPHYDFYEIEQGKQAFVIIPGDFVTETDGTGIVTIAAYGEDDLKAMKQHNVPITLHLEDDGRLKSFVPNWGGLHYLEVNPLVNADLLARGLMYKEEVLEHRVPHCWRCHTRLIHAPQNAWYVDVQKLKKQMERTNKQVYWYPEHFAEGRYLKSMLSAPDWCISRNRYWGSPVPVWECQCGELKIPESLTELSKWAGYPVKNLHKPEIDNVILTCDQCQNQMHRTSEVLDSWIEAGSASFAERHFPFDSTHKLEDFYPPDFITEYTGQIRAWFYVLHVIGTSLFNSPAFKKVLVSGVILGTDGRKMSKNYGNYPDPKQMLQTHGGDALRLYLLGSPVMHGEDIRISENDYRNWVKNFSIPLWNSFKYLLTYIDESMLCEFQSRVPDFSSLNVLDQWILSRLSSTQESVNQGLEKLDTMTSTMSLQEFVNDLSNWYIRRSRPRVTDINEDINDKHDFLFTLWYVLKNFSQIVAPFAPFISEYLYKELTNQESVHLSDWPNLAEKYYDQKLEQQMDQVRKIVERGHSIRKSSNLGVRQPLSTIFISGISEISKSLTKIILDELNVKSISWAESEQLEVKLDLELTSELIEEGRARELIRQIQIARKQSGCSLDEIVSIRVLDWPARWEKNILKAVKGSDISKGEFRIIRQ